jgi:Domain of unknown function (DUF4164)
MSDTSAVDQAVKRLLDALDALDAVIELRLEEYGRRGLLAEQVHAFSLDRARLASELDGAAARSRVLETTNREAARRLDEAMNTIRAVIVENQP